MQYSALVAQRAMLLPLEKQRRRPRRRPQARQSGRPAGRWQQWMPSSPAWGASGPQIWQIKMQMSKEKRKNNDRGSVMQCKHIWGIKLTSLLIKRINQNCNISMFRKHTNTSAETIFALHHSSIGQQPRPETIQIQLIITKIQFSQEYQNLERCATSRMDSMVIL